MKFTLFADPGHGWLRVDIQSARSVGLDKSSFSYFSYEHGPWLYLEEDHDAGIFLRAYRERHGAMPTITYNTNNRASCIRNYARIAG